MGAGYEEFNVINDRCRLVLKMFDVHNEIYARIAARALNIPKTQVNTPIYWLLQEGYIMKSRVVGQVQMYRQIKTDPWIDRELKIKPVTIHKNYHRTKDEPIDINWTGRLAQFMGFAQTQPADLPTDKHYDMDQFDHRPAAMTINHAARSYGVAPYGEAY